MTEPDTKYGDNMGNTAMRAGSKMHDSMVGQSVNI
jgi:hypothetical protein